MKERKDWQRFNGKAAFVRGGRGDRDHGPLTHTSGALLAVALGFLLACPAQPPAAPEAKPGALAGALPSMLGDCPINQPLKSPHVIDGVGDGATLETTLVVRKVPHENVPVVSSSGDSCELQSMELRTYGYPGPSGPVFEIPGPTLLANMTYLENPAAAYDPQTNPVKKKGSRIKVLLKNELPPSVLPAKDCQPVTYWACENDPNQNCTSNDGITWTCPDETQTCVETPFEQTSPNCFHGAEVTNLHYHGSHVSPQPHQDFVLLELYSADDPNAPPPNGYDVARGEYQTDIPQLPWNQAPGTHWYHPHKHGSTATQVGNGMAGAFLIQGPFDDWLFDEYGLTTPAEREQFDKLLVVHQMTEAPPFFTQFNASPPYPLVNGQLIPQVTMRRGEIQRWRFVGATMNGSAQLDIRFPDGFAVKQIAQDGVQFAPENYTTPNQPFTKVDSDGKPYWTLSPGNRMDFLVQAPQMPGPYRVSQRVSANRPQAVVERVRRRAAGVRSSLGIPQPPGTGDRQEFEEVLFAVDVTADLHPMDFPDTWPPTPAYLSNIDQVTNERTVAYSMSGAQGSLPNAFLINDTEFDGSCAALSVPYMKLGEAEQWTITNSSGPRHPHHIHVNPFQLLESPDYPNVATNGEPYPWMDTISLPAGGTDNVQQVVIRQRYEDYSGAFVFHCHFLAHEDRGMMKVVQTVCPDNEKFGTPRPDGLPDDCAVPSSAYPSDLNPYPPCTQ